MSSTTDPYQPLETTHRMTRRCLEVFARYPDLELLVIQTRSPLAARDFASGFRSRRLMLISAPFEIVA